MKKEKTAHHTSLLSFLLWFRYPELPNQQQKPNRVFEDTRKWTKRDFSRTTEGAKIPVLL